MHKKALRPVIGVLILFASAIITGCTSSPAEKRADFMESGKAYAAEGDYARAIIQFRNAVRAMPDDAEANYQLGLAYLKVGSVQEAVQALFKTTELQPHHAAAQLLLADMMTRSRNPDLLTDAQERAETVLAASPDNSDARFILAATKVQMGHREEAMEQLHEALERYPQHLKSSVALATLRLREKDLAGAEAILKSAVEQAPDQPEPLVALGQLYVLLQRPEEAEAQFSQALAMAPNHSPALLAQAGLLLRSGRKEEAEKLYQKVSESPGERYKLVYGQYLSSQKDFGGAVAEFKRLYEEDSSDRNTRNRLVAAYLADKRVKEAESVLDKALEENSKDFQARLQRAEVLFNRGLHSEALEEVTQVLQFEPTSAEAHYLLGRIHTAQGDPLRGRDELNEALRLKPELLLVRLEVARWLTAAKDSQAALDVLDAAPDAQKNVLQFIEARNWALITSGDLDEVRKGVEQGLQQARTATLLTQDGILRLGQRDFEGARSSVQEALESSPAYTNAVKLLAQSHIAEGNPEMAVQVVRDYATRNSDSAGAQLFAAGWMLGRGQRDDARQAYLTVLILEPSNDSALYRLAQLDALEKNFDSARDRLTTILSSNEENTRARLLLGKVESLSGRHDKAAEYYRKVVEDNPDNVHALNNLAYHLAEYEDRPDEALQHAQRAKELAPENASVDDTIGWVYYKKGLYQTALPHFLTAASRRKKNAEVQYHLALTYLRLGELEKGREVLVRAQNLDPDAPESQIAQELLAQAQ